MAVTQELATDPIGATQEPPVGEQKEDDLHVAITQKPATDPIGATQEPPIGEQEEDALGETDTQTDPIGET